MAQASKVKREITQLIADKHGVQTFKIVAWISSGFNAFVN